MNNKELLFNLIKKLESGEIVLVDYKGEFWLSDGKDKIKFLEVIKWTASEKDGEPKLDILTKENFPEWNKEFKENFYKEKGLDKCWVKDCLNKIYQKEGDYKKIKVPCREAHTRMVCLGCSGNRKEIENRRKIIRGKLDEIKKILEVEKVDNKEVKLASRELTDLMQKHKSALDEELKQEILAFFLNSFKDLGEKLVEMFKVLEENE